VNTIIGVELVITSCLQYEVFDYIMVTEEDAEMPISSFYDTMQQQSIPDFE
jgi:hypothetical protein